MFRLFMLFCLKIVSSRPPYFNPRRPDHSQRDWWYDFGNDDETTKELEKSTSSLATYNYMKKQMDIYGYAQHIGTINRGQFLNSELSNPKDRTFGYGSDFNPRDFHLGVFRHKPAINKYYQNLYATQAMVDLGMAKNVGEITQLPTNQLVQNDGTVLVTLDTRVRRRDPCNPNPCVEKAGFENFECEVVNYFTVKCSRPSSYDITLQWFWPEDTTKVGDRKSYLALGVIARRTSDPSVRCHVVSSNYMLGSITDKGPGPKCGVSITHLEDKLDAAGNIVSGGINLHFGKVASDASNYHDYKYEVLTYYYCNDLTQPQTPACVTDIYEAAARIKLVKSVGGVEETFPMPKKSSRKRKKRSTDDDNDVGSTYNGWYCSDNNTDDKFCGWDHDHSGDGTELYNHDHEHGNDFINNHDHDGIDFKDWDYLEFYISWGVWGYHRYCEWHQDEGHGHQEKHWDCHYHFINCHLEEDKENEEKSWFCRTND